MAKEKHTQPARGEQFLPDPKVSADVEKQLLIFGADSLLKNKFSDTSLDRHLEKVELLGGNFINLHKRYLVESIRPYVKKFPLDFYREIYRLNNWPTDEKKLLNRPGIVGTWTNQMIYCRFPKGILQSLQTRNPISEVGIRMHKHFQWLTVLGETELLGFIDDALRVMKKSRYWDEFRRLFAQEFGAPYQLDLFEGY